MRFFLGGSNSCVPRGKICMSRSLVRRGWRCEIPGFGAALLIPQDAASNGTRNASGQMRCHRKRWHD
jgi:hypothetical protein